MTVVGGVSVQAAVFTGSLGLTLSSTEAQAMVSAFAANPSALRTALQDGIANGLGISASMVQVTGVTLGTRRRLEERRLTDATVDVAYVITVPANSGTTLTTASITGAQTQLKDGINSAMSAASLPYTVSALTAPAPTETTTTVVGPTLPSTQTADFAHKIPASHMAIIVGLGAVAFFAH